VDVNDYFYHYFGMYNFLIDIESTIIPTYWQIALHFIGNSFLSNQLIWQNKSSVLTQIFETERNQNI
jgi:hypothetical protein